MKTRLIILTTLLLILLSLPVMSVFAAKPTEVVKPMKGSFWGTWAQTSATVASDEGNGLFTHAGLSTFSGILTTIWRAPDYVIGDVSGTIILTAANGDTLNVDVLGIQTIDTSYAFADFVGTYTIVGGTRRFAGASGIGTIGAHLTIIPVTYDSGEIQNGYMVGTIVLPKA